jgi:hypothetical protein
MRRSSTVRILDQEKPNQDSRAQGEAPCVSPYTASSPPKAICSSSSNGAFGAFLAGHESSSTQESAAKRQPSLGHLATAATVLGGNERNVRTASSVKADQIGVRAPLLAPSSPSLPKPSVEQLVAVGDVSALVSLMAQRHAVERDRDKLLSLSDIAGRLLTDASMMPLALDNIHVSNRREVLLEELAAHRVKVQHLHHLAQLAEDEHERLLTMNDSLLSIAKKKDDVHAQTRQQFYIAGSMDAEANETLLKLEGRRRTLAGFATSLQNDVDRCANPGKAMWSKQHEGPKRTASRLKLTATPATDVTATTPLFRRTPQLVAKHQATQRSPLSRRAPVPQGTISRNASLHQTSEKDDAAQCKTQHDVERCMFDLRMSGHELLAQFEPVIARGLDADVPGGVERAMRTANVLRQVLGESSDARGSLWLFSPCTRPGCQAMRERLLQLLAK